MAFIIMKCAISKAQLTSFNQNDARVNPQCVISWHPVFGPFNFEEGACGLGCV